MSSPAPAPGATSGACLISEKALFTRVARALRREQGETLRRCRWDSSWFNELGRYYTSKGNWIQARGLDLSALECWGREFGVLRPHEGVITD